MWLAFVFVCVCVLRIFTPALLRSTDIVAHPHALNARVFCRSTSSSIFVCVCVIAYNTYFLPVRMVSIHTYTHTHNRNVKNTFTMNIAGSAFGNLFYANLCVNTDDWSWLLRVHFVSIIQTMIRLYIHTRRCFVENSRFLNRQITVRNVE